MKDCNIYISNDIPLALVEEATHILVEDYGFETGALTSAGPRLVCVHGSMFINASPEPGIPNYFMTSLGTIVDVTYDFILNLCYELETEDLEDEEPDDPEPLEHDIAYDRGTGHG